MKDHGSGQRGNGQHRVVVTGIGVLSPLGDSPQALHHALCAGQSGQRQVDLFSTERMGNLLGGQVPQAPESYLGSGANVRPLDRTGRLVTAAVQLALTASGWTLEMRRAHEVGLVLGTMFGGLHTIASFDRRILEAGPAYVKPFDFANSVISAAAGQTAIWHHLRGINSTVAGGTTAGLQALIYAADMVRNGRTQAILAGGADELCFESFFGFYRAGRLAGSVNGGAPCAIPFDTRRNGFFLSEGAVFLMLEAADAALRRGAPILAEIRGHGSAYDPSRGRTPGAAAAAIARSIRLALDDAGLTPAAVDVVSASANGSVGSDQHEAHGIASALEDVADLPVIAIKSMLGEAMGASGALQAVAAIEALHTGVWPAIAGLAQLPADFPLPGVLRQNHPAQARRVLLNAVGLHGNAYSLILEPCAAPQLAAELAEEG